MPHTRAYILILLLLLPTVHARASSDLHAERPGNRELHVAAGISIALVAGGVHMALHENQTTAALTGAAAAMTAGVVKEVADAFGFGVPSIADVLLTAAGGLAGAYALYGISRQSTSLSAHRTLGIGSALSGLTFSFPVVRELIHRITRN